MIKSIIKKSKHLFWFFFLLAFPLQAQKTRESYPHHSVEVGLQYNKMVDIVEVSSYFPADTSYSDNFKVYPTIQFSSYLAPYSKLVISPIIGYSRIGTYHKVLNSETILRWDQIELGLLAGYEVFSIVPMLGLKACGHFNPHNEYKDAATKKWIDEENTFYSTKLSLDVIFKLHKVFKIIDMNIEGGARIGTYDSETTSNEIARRVSYCRLSVGYCFQ